MWFVSMGNLIGLYDGNHIVLLDSAGSFSRTGSGILNSRIAEKKQVPDRDYFLKYRFRQERKSRGTNLL